MKKDFTPTFMDFGTVQIFLARHFGFCYGVENAIEIAFRTIEENPKIRIFLLSEMIHNPQVNADLHARGVQFLQDTSGRQLFPFDQLTKEDIVIVPAFGTTLEIEKKLQDLGVHSEKYNTTCPFVEKVWNRSAQIGEKKYTVIIHGKPGHEETRATFSHATLHGPTLIISDMREAELLGSYIMGDKNAAQFYQDFKNQYSDGFDVNRDLEKIGVVNQTTMLASDTQAIADFLKQAIEKKYPHGSEEHVADTRDTLCYATYDNQAAAINMLKVPAEFAIVVGGYNSSNTSHLVELCQEKLPTYFINSEEKILSDREILHYDLHAKQEILSTNYLPGGEKTRILLTSGASCPDALVEGVINKLTGLFPGSKLDDPSTSA
jgi:4-hydroxy-3-methylbut-2-en-1-yl diphosphate reductase